MGDVMRLRVAGQRSWDKAPMLLQISYKGRRLATGDWRLATGDWRLATGDWRLVGLIAAASSKRQ